MKCFDHEGLHYEKKLEGMMKKGHLLVENLDRAHDIFQQISPFHLENYGLPWRNTDGTYREGTTLEMLYESYHADREMKNYLFDYLAIVEVQLRNVLGFVMDEAFGTFGYLDADNFRREDYHKHFQNDLENELHRANEPYVKAYRSRGDEDRKVPVYVALEVVTMGTLCKLYANLKRREQKKVAQFYEVPGDQALTSIFKCLTTIRNTCAHHGRLSFRNFRDACVILNADRPILAHWAPEYTPDPHAFFVPILGLLHLLDEYQATMLIQQLHHTFETHPHFLPEYLNFPTAWEQIFSDSTGSDKREENDAPER